MPDNTSGWCNGGWSTLRVVPVDEFAADEDSELWSELAVDVDFGLVDVALALDSSALSDVRPELRSGSLPSLDAGLDPVTCGLVGASESFTKSSKSFSSTASSKLIEDRRGQNATFLITPSLSLTTRQCHYRREEEE